MGLNESAGYLAVAAHRAAHRRDRRGCRASPRTVPGGRRLRRPGTRPLDPRCSRDPWPRPPREPATHDRDERPDATGRCSSSPAFASRRSPRPARPAWSTTSTTASPGDSSPSYSPRPDSPSARRASLVALYPAVWGLGQLATGALSDRWGRKHLITAGMLLQAAALAIIASAESMGAWAAASVLLGAGTAMVYPTLLASIGDVAHPSLACSRGRRLPAVARPRVRRRCPPRRLPGRRVRRPRGDLGRRRPHRGLGRGRRGAHVRDPPNVSCQHASLERDALPQVDVPVRKVTVSGRSGGWWAATSVKPALSSQVTAWVVVTVR